MTYRTAGQRLLGLRTSRPGGQIVVIEASGAVDSSTADRFAELVRARLAATVRTVVLDLSRLAHMSTDGVVVLVEARHRALLYGVSLTLITRNRVVDRLLDMLDLAEEFTYADTVEAAEAPAVSAVLPQPRVPEQPVGTGSALPGRRTGTEPGTHPAR